MISIIVCTNRPAELLKLEQSVNETIGLPYELIALNSSNCYHSIFKAYNTGIAKSRFETLCFVHDDVRFETANWGKILFDHLNDTKSGFIGVAGGPVVARIPAPWSFDKKIIHLNQSNATRSKSEYMNQGVFNKKHFAPAVVLDGVFLACRKELFDTISFDEKTYHGFHSYDQDTCLQAHFAGYENRVINDLLITHFSKGNLDKSWIESQLLFWRKWINQLPASVEPYNSECISKKEKKYLEGSMSRKFIRYGYSNRQIRTLLAEYNERTQALGNQKAKFRLLVVTWQRICMALS
jgi:hypothetical protein